ncbi:MAG: hypothetical protein HOV83_10565 [Catenulispora sp.]|nr:hypothetical protein [Catenulispora sp.]
MNEEQLAAFYADNARHRQTAEREFKARRHGWTFALSPEASRWADSFAATAPPSQDPSAWAAHLVERADADGVIIKPEPGRVRSAYAHRDPQTERETAIGFGFHPDASEALIVHAGTAVPLDAVSPAIGGGGAAALAVLRLVVDSFATVRPFSA